MSGTTQSESSVNVVWGLKYSHSQGSDIKFSAGTSSGMSMSLDTKISAGVSSSISLAGSSSLALYDSKYSHHLSGVSTGVELAYQKSYQDTFSISVGSLAPKNGWLLNLLFGASILGSVGPLATIIYSGINYRVFAGQKLEDADAKKTANSWHGIAVVATAAAAAVAAAVVACAHHSRKHKKLTDRIDKSKGILSISKNARAFIGTQGSHEASGLQFHEGKFKLRALGSTTANLGFTKNSFGEGIDPNEKSFPVRHGWEVVGLRAKTEDIQVTEVRGDAKSLKMQSHSVTLGTDKEGKDQSRIALTDDKLIIEAKKKNASIDVSADQSIEIVAGSKRESSIKMNARSLTLGVETCNIKIDKYKVNVSGLMQGQSIEFSKKGIKIAHGDNGIDIGSSGVVFCDGALKINNFAVVIPDFEAKMKAEQEKLAKSLEDKLQRNKELLEGKIQDASEKVVEMIDNVKSSILPLKESMRK